MAHPIEHLEQIKEERAICLAGNAARSHNGQLCDITKFTNAERFSEEAVAQILKSLDEEEVYYTKLLKEEYK